jgi:hypothetical protein
VPLSCDAHTFPDYTDTNTTTTLTQRLQERDADVARALARADTAVQSLAAAEAAAAATAGSEAVLRRLDNERQYLRSQLESELTCKSELQEALERAQRQLNDVKLGWQRDQDRLFLVRISYCCGCCCYIYY